MKGLTWESCVESTNPLIFLRFETIMDDEAICIFASDCIEKMGNHWKEYAIC